MGREVRRIHLDWDLFERKGNTTWQGYLLDSMTCPLCEGSGKNLKGKRCPQCYGEGKDTPKIEPPKYYEWNDEEFGYQIWQTVSEGGPVSPVFKKPEDLAEWMVDNDNSVTRGTSYEAWLKMIQENGYAPSGVMSSSGFSTGMQLYEDKE